MSDRIGIIAGGGQFPRLIAEEARQRGNQVAICGFVGNTAPDLASQANWFEMIYLGQFGKLLAFFRRNEITQLCFAGAIDKPGALEIKPDLHAAKLLFSQRKKGDDSLLRMVIRELEHQGFEVLSAANLLPSLRSPTGLLTKCSPTRTALEDIRFAWPIARTMGGYDIGQCLVAREGMVLAVECLEGTDSALRRGAELGGKGCVAVKLVKPGQDERVDLPSIGLTTIRNLVELQYSALAIEAGKTLFFDSGDSLALANKHKLAVLAIADDHLPD